MFLAFAYGLLGKFALSNVVDCQQNHPKMIDAAASDHQSPAPHVRKILIDLEIREGVGALAKTIQRIPQAGKVPTALRQRIDDLALGFEWRYLKRPIESPV